MMVEGFLLVHKPVGITSFQVIRQLRQLTGVKRIGHAGTLDPFASGLLIVGIGRQYTKQLDLFLTSNKSYEVTFVLGQTTTTYDCDGEIVTSYEGPIEISRAVFDKVWNGFLGEQLQRPPDFSAKKIGGVRAYKLARKGQPVALSPKPICIEEIDCLSYESDQRRPVGTLSVTCSKGTYIRSLVHDIGQKLGVGAYAKTLVRTKIGKYSLERAVALEGLTLAMIQSSVVAVL